jgi:hypothetical protein
MSKIPTAVAVALVVCATVLGLGAVAGFVALVLYAPPETDLVKLLGAIGTGAALVAAQIAQYLKTRQMGKSVEYLANGGTDAKVRAGVADVIDPRYLKAGVKDQLEADRAHRLASPALKGDQLEATPASSSSEPA